MANDKFTSVLRSNSSFAQSHNLSVNIQQSYSSICQLAALLGCRIISTKEKTKRKNLFFIEKFFLGSWFWIIYNKFLKNRSSLYFNFNYLLWSWLLFLKNNFLSQNNFWWFEMVEHSWDIVMNRGTKVPEHILTIYRFFGINFFTAFTVLSSASSKFIWLFVLI